MIIANRSPQTCASSSAFSPSAWQLSTHTVGWALTQGNNFLPPRDAQPNSERTSLLFAARCKLPLTTISRGGVSERDSNLAKHHLISYLKKHCLIGLWYCWVTNHYHLIRFITATECFPSSPHFLSCTQAECLYAPIATKQLCCINAYKANGLICKLKLVQTREIKLSITSECTSHNWTETFFFLFI